MIGNSWSMAQLSGSDWKSEKLQKYRSTSVGVEVGDDVLVLVAILPARAAR